MQTQPKPDNSVNTQRLKKVLGRYESAVAENAEGLSDESDVKELETARAELLDILREARIVVENHDSPRWEYAVGKALKDWATAIMENRGVTRAVARERIMDAIKLMTATEYPSLNPNVVREYIVQGAESGRIQTSEPNFTQLDHLPEGSH